MKQPAISLVLGAVLLWFASAAAQPAVIPQSGQARRDASRTFEILKHYFSDPARNMFTLVSADPASHRIVAKRSGIDTQTWGEWSYCKLNPEHMIDTLEDGSVMVTVKIDPAGRDASYVEVTADFEGTYGLGSSETTTQCVSKDVLENNILQAAGAAQSGA
jgi:hypothetical protein